jgi:hypothetical protein
MWNPPITPSGTISNEPEERERRRKREKISFLVASFCQQPRAAHAHSAWTEMSTLLYRGVYSKIVFSARVRLYSFSQQRLIWVEKGEEQAKRREGYRPVRHLCHLSFVLLEEQIKIHV